MIILLVEDDTYFSQYITYELKGVQVLVAGTLAVAKDILKAAVPALMVIDLGLPDSRGLATLEAFKSFVGPKIVITATCKDLVNECAALGAVDYIRKDCDMEGVVARIQFNIEKHRPRERFSESVFSQIQACLASAPQLISV